MKGLKNLLSGPQSLSRITLPMPTGLGNLPPELLSKIVKELKKISNTAEMARASTVSRDFRSEIKNLNIRKNVRRVYIDIPVLPGEWSKATENQKKNYLRGKRRNLNDEKMTKYISMLNKRNKNILNMLTLNRKRKMGELTPNQKLRYSVNKHYMGTHRALLKILREVK